MFPGLAERVALFFSAVLFVWNGKNGYMPQSASLLPDSATGSLRSGRLAPQPLELSLCKAVYYFFLGEYDMPSAGISTLQACATMHKTACTVPS